MPVPRKPAIGQGTQLTGTVPPLPEIPEKTLNRFEELEGYEAAMQRWWSRFGELNQRDREQIMAQILADREADAAAIAAANARITALSELVTALQAQVEALIAEDLEDAITALQDAFVQHVGANVAHGTTSPIVGTTDNQQLENKTLGLANPKYGRFAPPMGYGNVPHGTTVTVNSGDFLIVAGTFEIIGQLQVDGTLVAV